MRRCGRYQEIIARYLHGGVLLQEKEELESHLSVCAACESLYRGVSEADRVLRHLPDKQPEPSPYLKARILANLPDSAPAGPRFEWVRWLPLAGGAAVCAIAALLVVAQERLSVERSNAPATAAAPRGPGEQGTRATPPAARDAAGKTAAPAAVASAKRGGADGAPTRVQIIREVKVYFYYPPAQKVAVTGDFNGWDPKGVSLEPTGKPGLWTANLRLHPGAYSYNFIVDGEVLVPDPNAANQAPDGYGGTNSILLVKGDNPA